MNKGTKIGLIIFTILILAVAAVFGIKEYMITSTPTNHLEYSMFKSYQEVNTDISMNAKMSFGDEALANLTYLGFDEEMTKQVKKMINKISLGYDLKLVTDNPEHFIDLYGSYKINYAENPLIDMRFVLDSEIAAVGINNFYDKYFMVEYKDLIEKLLLQEDIDLSELDLNEYVNVLKNIEFKLEDYEKYKEVLDTYLDKHLTKIGKTEITLNEDDVKVTEYALKIDMKDYLDAYLEILEIAYEDVELKELYKDMLLQLIDKAIETEDYLLFDIRLEEIEEFRAEVDEDFNIYWEEAYSEYKSIFEDAASEISAIEAIEFEYNLSFFIDRRHNIRRMDAILDTEVLGFEMSVVINNRGKDVVIDKSEFEYINIEELIDFDNPEELKEEAVAKLIKEMIKSGVDEVLNGDAYKSLFEDLKYFDDFIDIEAVIASIEEVKEYIDELSDEEVIELIKEELYGTEETYEYTDDYADVAALITTGNIYDSLPKSDLWDGLVSSSEYYDFEAYLYETDYYTEYEAIDDALYYGSDIIILQGEELSSYIEEYAPDYPDVQFVLIDGESDYQGSNFIQMNFVDDESIFVAGYIASLETETNNVAVVGIDGVTADKYNVLFENGAKYDSDVEVFILDADSALEAIEENDIDVVYNMAGEHGHYIIDEAEERGFYVIGDQSTYGDYSYNFITSLIRDYNYAAVEAVDYYMSYGPMGDSIVYDLAYEMIYFPNYNMSESTEDLMYDMTYDILDGFVTVEY